MSAGNLGQKVYVHAVFSSLIFALREKCRKSILTLSDVVRRGPFPLAPFAVRWLVRSDCKSVSVSVSFPQLIPRNYKSVNFHREGPRGGVVSVSVTYLIPKNYGSVSVSVSFRKI